MTACRRAIFGSISIRTSTFACNLATALNTVCILQHLWILLYILQIMRKWQRGWIIKIKSLLIIRNLQFVMMNEIHCNSNFFVLFSYKNIIVIYGEGSWVLKTWLPSIYKFNEIHPLTCISYCFYCGKVQIFTKTKTGSLNSSTWKGLMEQQPLVSGFSIIMKGVLDKSAWKVSDGIYCTYCIIWHTLNEASLPNQSGFRPGD